MYIDTHAHLTFSEFQNDLTEVIARARSARIETIINIALDDISLKRSLRLAEEYPDLLFTAAGIHPQEASEWDDNSYRYFKELLTAKKIIAVGETGLDYFYKLSPVEKQQEVFRNFLRLGQEADRPVIIHSRDAAADTINILQQENKGRLKAVLHCFTGDTALAEAALDMGLYISFTGNITFPKAEKIRQAARDIPLERIMIETDCPFLAPQDYRGKRNEPAYVIKVAEKIAEIRKITTEEVAIATTTNSRRFFGL